MLFLTFSKVEIDFVGKELIWKAYTIAETLPTIKRVQIINLKKFAKVVLDPKQEGFVIHVTTLFQHLEWEIQITTLISDKALIIVPAEYLDFDDVFSKKSAVVLPKYTEINKHTINLEENK